MSLRSNLYLYLAKKLKPIPFIWNLFKQLYDSFIRARDLFFTPFAGIAHKKYRPNNKITLAINAACNIKCLNCYVLDKTDGEMSVAQIRSFVDEALESGLRWDELELRGGETTLHSHFFDILEIVKEYKEKVPDCRVTILTNGFGPRVNEIIAKIPAWAEVSNVHKNDQQKVYTNFWVFTRAPVDLWPYKLFTDFSKGCNLISNCFGLCLSKYGYYPHPPCAEVDKIFGFNLGIKKLSLVNEKALRNQMRVLCRYCGFFIEPRKSATKEKWSKTWIKVYQEYKKQKPRLSEF